ncbi:hypothetical protein P7L78_07850 [Tistrella bauzanensis]|uniref:hypothetical protein n=1 Tax=Tistrella TaxID=171436 RepID=UPI0031F6D342
MISTANLMILAADPQTAAALIAAMTPEEAAQILGQAGQSRGFKFDWRSLIPRLKRTSSDRDLDDAALEAVAGGLAGNTTYVPLSGNWSIIP